MGFFCSHHKVCIDHKVKNASLNVKGLESTNPNIGLFMSVNTFRMYLMIIRTPVQFWFSAFVLLYVVKMTEMGVQTKGRVKGNVLIFGFYFIFSLHETLLESRTLFPVKESKLNCLEGFCCNECYFQFFLGKLL